MKALLAFTTAWAAVAAAELPHWVAEYQRGWSFAYNQGDYEAVAAPLSRRGVIVPIGGDVILRNRDVLAYLRQTHAQHSRQLLLWPTDGVARDGVFETVGMNWADNTTYYMRMTADGETWEDWRIDTVVLASPKIKPVETEASAPEWLNAKLHDIRAMLAAGAAADVVEAHVAADAVAAALDGTLHTSRARLASDFAMLAPSPTSKPHLLRLVAFHAEEDVGEYHMVAESVSTLTHLVNRCYMRWVKDAAGVAKIATFMVSIGTDYEGVHKAAGAPPPPVPAWLNALGTSYGRAFSAADYDALSDIHRAGSVVVPWGGDGFITEDIPEYLLDAHKTRPAIQLQTRSFVERPRQVSFGAPSWVHTLGVDAVDGAPYYMRWGMHHDADPTWRLGVTAFNLGAGMTGIPVTPPGVPAWMEAGVAKWVSLYNAAKFEALAGMYSREAVLVPVEVNASTLQFIERGGLAGYFETAAAAAPVVSAVRIVAAAPLGAAWHVIVELAASKQLLIYTRWVREDGQWWVETQLPLGAAPASYDCRTKEMWTRPKQQWCCAHQGLGCPTAGAVCRITDSTFDLSAYCPAGTECLQSEGLGEFTCQGR
eukprot:TRINITY_DN4164_c0_g3_i2.p1 TRINITY_DN4164_c0_g3~~TRINITY_DN4164_c0_g3_i2.p1  ORF type:complete len:596 (+),score=154.24 TRINITY_DN4164_c0_g3_i2:55-1842(+)